MYRSFWLFMFFLVSAQNLDEHDKCTTKNGLPGTCRFLNDCKDAVTELQTKGFHRLTRCSFQGLNEIICCPSIESLFVGSTSLIVEGQIVTDHKNEGNNEGFNKSVVAIAPENSEAIPNGIEVAKIARPAARACSRIVQNSVPPLQDHIIGGTDAAPGEFPHMVALGYPRRNGTFAFLCGGSLISDRFVLTAAHCLGRQRRRDNNTTPLISRLGTITVEDGNYNNNTDYNISDIYIHPEYKQFHHDIGLVRLNRQVIFNENLLPACLPLTADVPARLVITGWGVVNFEDRSRLSTMQKATINLVQKQECEEKYKSFKLDITDSMICAIDKDGKDACQGDSGGPLQALTENDAYFRVLGVVSFGHGCGSKVPGVYTKVFSYLSWLEGIVWPDDMDLQINPKE